MSMQYLIKAILVLLVSGATLTAQPASTARQVTVEGRLATDRIPAGGTARLAIIMHVNKGWHVNSHQPTFDYLIGTSFELQPQSNIILADVQYPNGNLVSLAFADKPIDVYEGTVVIYASVKVSEKTQPGADTLKGMLTAQACNNLLCLAPSTIDVRIPVQIVKAGEQVALQNQELFSNYHPTELAAAPQKNELAAMFEEKGSLIAFLSIFLIGLALNLTPCVYPMLSVTVSLFGTQSEASFGRVFLRALLYTLGIATMYSALGVLAAFGGGLFGSWLQSPWVLGGIAVLLFGLALSSFGVYQIQAPYWLTSKLGGATGTGFIAIYLSGLVVGVFAAPCVGPPVIALLAFVAAKGNPVFGFWAFFLLSLGLGLPYLILGTFSGLLKKIPRSGSWLVWIEHAFGVVLAGAGLFYLLLAVAPKFSLYVVPITLVIGGIYLGFLDESGKEKRWLKIVQWLFGLATIVIGILFANSLTQKGISWETYSDAEVLDCKENGMPVVIDFYADWCIPCLELDRKTWTDPEVIRKTRDLTRLKVDLTQFDSPESDAIRRKYNISGVPTIVFLKPDGAEASEARIVGFVPPGEFLAKLKQANSNGS
jgi:thiol:disulfide interchange protein DsbD